MAASSSCAAINDMDPSMVQNVMTGSQKGKQLLSEIEDLRSKQRAKRVEKAMLAKELKLAVRKRARLRKRARMLSNDDLCEVLAIRTAKAAERAGATPSETSREPGDDRSNAPSQ